MTGNCGGLQHPSSGSRQGGEFWGIPSENVQVEGEGGEGGSPEGHFCPSGSLVRHNIWFPTPHNLSNEAAFLIYIFNGSENINKIIVTAV